MSCCESSSRNELEQTILDLMAKYFADYTNESSESAKEAAVSAAEALASATAASSSQEAITAIQQSIEDAIANLGMTLPEIQDAIDQLSTSLAEVKAYTDSLQTSISTMEFVKERQVIATDGVDSIIVDDVVGIIADLHINGVLQDVTHDYLFDLTTHTITFVGGSLMAGDVVTFAKVNYVTLSAEDTGIKAFVDWTYTAQATIQSLTVPVTFITVPFIFLNGTRLTPGEDYTAGNQVINFITGSLVAGDVLILTLGVTPNNVLGLWVDYSVTTVTQQAMFSPGTSFERADVYINGLILTPTTEYTISSNQILLVTPVAAGSRIYCKLYS